MSDDRPNPDEILHSLQLLRSPDAKDRKQGIQVLSGLADDPRVLQVFEYLYQIDPDPDVRDMAWQAILWRGPSVPAPGPEVSVREKEKESANGGSYRLFLMNPANAKLVARRTPRRGRLASLLAMLLLFVAGVFWGLAIPYWLTWYEFRQEGDTAQGEVISLEERDADRYIAFYRFTLGSEEEELFYSGEQDVSREFYDTLAQDTPVEVIYLPDDPNQSRLDDSRSPENERRLQLAYVAAGLTVMIVLLFVLSAVQRRRPERDKHLIRGQVVSITGHRDNDGDFNIKLRYRFQPPGAREIVDQTSQIRNDLDPRNLPAPGTPIVVYYQNEHSYRLL